MPAFGPFVIESRMPRLRAIVLAAISSSCLAAPLDEPIKPLPATLQQDPARADIGRRLFQDQRLSANGKVSCASCHDLSTGGADRRPHSVGFEGYSPLSNLKRFLVDTIKVDRSFVRELPASETDRAITDAIMNMAKTLSLSVVAEGVETQRQAEFLGDHGCDEIQGFYFSRAVPPAVIADMLNASPCATLQGKDVERSPARRTEDSAFATTI